MQIQSGHSKSKIQLSSHRSVDAFLNVSWFVTNSIHVFNLNLTLFKIMEFYNAATMNMLL